MGSRIAKAGTRSLIQYGKNQYPELAKKLGSGWEDAITSGNLKTADQVDTLAAQLRQAANTRQKPSMVDTTGAPPASEFGKNPRFSTGQKLGTAAGTGAAAYALSQLGSTPEPAKTTKPAKPAGPAEPSVLSMTEETVTMPSDKPPPDLAGLYQKQAAAAASIRAGADKDWLTAQKEALGELDTLEENLDSVDRDKFSEKRAMLKQAYDKKVASAEFGEIAEILAGAVAQLGAAYYGLKHGVDMSGQQFNMRDWEAKYDRLFKGYGLDLDIVEGEEAKAGRDIEKSNAARRDASNRKIQARLDALRVARSGKLAEADTAAGLAKPLAADKLAAWEHQQGKLKLHREQTEARKKKQHEEKLAKIGAGEKAKTEAGKTRKAEAKFQSNWYQALEGDSKYSDKARADVISELRARHPAATMKLLNKVVDEGPDQYKTAMEPSTSSFPRKVTNKAGDKVTVQNEQELTEARSEGFE